MVKFRYALDRSPIYGGAAYKILSISFSFGKRGKLVGKAGMGGIAKITPVIGFPPCCFPLVFENKRVKRTIYGRFVRSIGGFDHLPIYMGHIWAAFYLRLQNP